MDPITVVIVEDDERFRAAFTAVVAEAPDLRLAGAAGDLPQGLQLLREHRPDVLLVDLGLPSGSGIELIRFAHDHLPQTDVMVITVFGDEPHVMASLEAGATGYLLKDTPREQLVDAVRAAARGETVLAPPLAAKLMRQVRGGDQLTPRELEVLQLVAQGRSNPEIARELFIGEATVKTHLLHVFDKLGVDDRTRAVTVALERGILTTPTR